MADDPREIYRHDHLAPYLRAVLTSRSQEDPGYSLRQLAKDLGLSAAYLSQLISRKKMLSAQRCGEVAQRLSLGTDQSRYLYILAQLDAAPSDDVRSALRKQLHDLAHAFPEQSLDADQFRAISDWHHVAILEMTYLDDFDGTPEQAAARLGIAVDVAEAAILRLTRLELLGTGEDGRLQKMTRNARFHAQHTDEAFAAFLRQMMQLASEAMDRQPVKERIIMSQTFCIAKGQLDEARAVTREYLQRMAGLFDTAPRKERCFQLNVQFFDLTDGRPKTNGAGV